MPLEILRSELPLITFWNLIADGEGKKVGGRAIAMGRRIQLPKEVSWCVTCQLVAS